MMTFAYILITISGLFILLTIYTVYINHSKRKEILSFYSDVIYVTGLKDIVGGSKTTLMIKKNEISLQKGINIIKCINKEDFMGVEIMNEHDIQRQVTLGRFLVFGVFSLLLQKNKAVYTNYLVLTYKQDNETKKLVLHPTYSLERILRNLKKYKEIIS